jgi:hypothetical protein
VEKGERAMKQSIEIEVPEGMVVESVEEHALQYFSRGGMVNVQITFKPKTKEYRVFEVVEGENIVLKRGMFFGGTTEDDDVLTVDLNEGQPLGKFDQAYREVTSQVEVVERSE